MCIPPLDGDTNFYFNKMLELKKKHSLNELSMGMSSDYLEAINFEASYIRIGSSIFGKRYQIILILVFIFINLTKIKKSFSDRAIHPAVGL